MSKQFPPPAIESPSSTFEDSSLYADVKERAQEYLLQRIEEMGGEFGCWSQAVTEKFVKVELDTFIRQNTIPVNELEAMQIARGLTRELTGLGPLQELIEDPAVEDILINNHYTMYVSRKGRLKKETVRFKDDEHVLRIIRRILAPLGRRLDESNPMVDARMPDGGRINVVIPPLSIDGVCASIRKFRKDPLTPQDLVDLGSFSSDICRVLEMAVQARCNILISGGTSSGKTSLLNALASFVPEHERVVSIEDTAELSLNHAHVVRLESRTGGFDGSGHVSIRDLLRNSLRMRPDRIIVGEVRGGEVLELLQAMNTGHDGSMGTIHASSPRECLYRIEMLAGFAGFQGSETSLRRQIAGAIDFIVQIGRLANGKRRLISLAEVTGMTNDVISMQELFRHEPSVAPDGQEVDRWVSLGIAPHSPKIHAWWRAQQAATKEPGHA
ncbi:MAG: CpaF family protein [Comamonas sp.]|nr:CpaF family protein [Candidatus Comamonas equi]